MRIIILGAGYGGLQAARLLASAGNDVLLFEKNKREDIGFNWPIDVEPTVFTDLQIPLPAGSVRCTSCLECYVSTSRKVRKIDIPDEKRPWHINGHELSMELVDLCEQDGVDFRFEKPVSELLRDETGSVHGVFLDGFPLEADLVIDSIGLQKQEDNGQSIRILNGYLTTARPKEETNARPRKVFMLNPTGKPGITELYQESDGTVRIFTGLFDDCDSETLKIQLSKLRMELDILEGKTIHEGCFRKMPVRSPSLKMVDDGFACIDKSNFLSDSLRSGDILAKTILQKGTAADSLWSYQVQYYKEILADSYYLQALKQALFNTDGKTLKAAYEDDLLTDQMLMFIAAKTRLAPEKSNLLPPFRILLKKPLFSASLAKANAGGQALQNLAQQIPETYSSDQITDWTEQMKNRL